MTVDCLNVIGKLRSGLDVVFEQFRQEDYSVGVQAQLDRWRTEARRTLGQVFGTEEADTFNSLSLRILTGSGHNRNDADLVLDYIQRVAAYLETLESGIQEGTVKPSGSIQMSGLSNVDPVRVFVVHGRNDKINRAVFSFLRAIRLNPLEWDTITAMLGGAPYVGDIVRKGIESSQATVVILTPDEQVALRQEFRTSTDKESSPQFQPRPNVFFEAGMALALGEMRTIFLEFGEQRSFSDIFGRHLIRMDDSAERRNTLVTRLESLGCPVNRSGAHWLTEGDFNLTIRESQTEQQMNLTEKMELSQAEQIIVKAVANKKHMTKAELLAVLNDSEVKLDYYLRRLQDAGLVGAHLSTVGAPTEYALFDNGIKYAVEVLGF